MNDKVKQAYKKAGFNAPATPRDANDEVFMRKTKRAKPDEYKVQITNVYRISQGKKDYIFYYRRIEVPDLAGNTVVKTELVGKDDMPTFRNNFNNLGEPEPVALSGFKTEYNIPYSPEKMEEILTKAEIEREDGEIITVDEVDTSTTNYVLVVPGGRKYGNFAADDFINRPFSELEYFGATGTFPDTQVAQEGEEEGETVEVNRRVVEAKKKFEASRQHQQSKAKKEEAQNRQETVEQQSQKRTVRAEATATFEKEAAFDEGTVPPQPTVTEEVNRSQTRPEVEQIKEEVVFALQRVDDPPVDEDEEIRKGFEEQEQAKKQQKKR